MGARAAALRATEYPHNLSTSNWGMAELIEAAVRAGTPELAADARSRLAEMARVSGTDWALGVAARSEALLAEDQRAEELYLEALDRLGDRAMAIEQFRTAEGLALSDADRLTVGHSLSTATR